MLKGYVPWGKPGAGAPMVKLILSNSASGFSVSSEFQFQNTSGGLVHARKGKLLEDNCETEPYAAEVGSILVSVEDFSSEHA